ncbi:MAG: hypothetical protein LBI27_03415 [Clostridiales bacterium]|jgi:acyl-ACP thioesterase|nr:hypothetical protein [Clostridiales bacterium]
MYAGKHRITYYDLDLMGRVKLSALLRMVHIAADTNATELGIGFRELSQMNMSFILQRFALGISRMPEYCETVTIRTWPDSIARGVFLRKGDMYDESGKKIMEWTSLWILFDIAARKILKPGALPIELPQFEDHGVKIMPEKIDLSEEGEEFFKYTHTVRYAEVDTNMHMNNSIYGDLIGNVLFPSIEAAQKSQPWREVQINYLAETRLCEEIQISARRENDTYIIVGTSAEKTSFAARVK